MSGFEIAGVVLGLFPIVCDAAKNLRGVFQGVQTWWQFEREFEDFILDVERQEIAFSQILDILLEPVDELDELSQRERDLLQGTPNSPLWLDRRVQAAMTRWVRERYIGSFMRQLKAMNDDLEELRGLLPIGKVYHLDSKSLESEIFRIKSSFSHRKGELISKIKDGNTNLYQFLEKAAHLQHSRTSTMTPPKGNTKIVMSFLEFQDRAGSVFRGFQRHWVCKCNYVGGHSCGISAQGPNVEVLFNNDADSRHIKVEIRPRETLPDPGEPFPAPGVTTRHQDVEVLRHQVSMKRKLKQLRKQVPKSFLKLTTSTLSVLSTPVKVETDGNLNGLERPPEKLKKKHQTGCDKLAPRVSRVQFDSPPKPLIATPASPSVFSRRGQVISDMCSAVKRGSQESCVGFLELPDAMLFLHLDPPGSSQFLETQTLQEFMDVTPRRAYRLKLGLAIIMTVLKLGPLWTPDSWHKSSLILLKTPESHPQPYIAHPSIHTTLKTTSIPTVAKTKASFLALGILLLELLFRDTLERQPFRENYLGNDMTDWCTAMKWQEKAEEEFGDKLAGAIRNCIIRAMEPTADLGNSAFLRAVWGTVVRPLEEYIQIYSSGV